MIRPQMPGPVLELMGTVGGRVEKVVFVAIVQHDLIYRALVDIPAQDK